MFFGKFLYRLQTVVFGTAHRETQPFELEETTIPVSPIYHRGMAAALPFELPPFQAVLSPFAKTTLQRMPIYPTDQFRLFTPQPPI